MLGIKASNSLSGMISVGMVLLALFKLDRPSYFEDKIDTEALEA